MKTTIIFLGLIALGFNNNTAAKELNAQDLVQQDLATVCVEEVQQNQLALVSNVKLAYVNNADEAVIFNPSTVIKSNYTKTAEDLVNEGKLVTEAQQDSYEPIALEMSLEGQIAESNQIIESSVDNEYYPLDFEKINRGIKSNKPCNNNIAVTLDLKL